MRYRSSPSSGAVVAGAVGVTSIFSVLMSGVLVLVAAVAILRGLVLTALWQWFVQPVFLNAPDINIGEAIGLSLIVSYLTVASHKSDSSGMGMAIFGPFLTLGIGALLHFVFGVGM